MRRSHASSTDASHDDDVDVNATLGVKRWKESDLDDNNNDDDVDDGRDVDVGLVNSEDVDNDGGATAKKFWQDLFAELRRDIFGRKFWLFGGLRSKARFEFWNFSRKFKYLAETVTRFVNNF